MALQLIDLNEDIEYINIDASKVPYSFSIKLTDKTFSFTVKYNDTGGFYTIDLLDANGNVLVFGEIVRYARPLCITGDSISEVTKENFGKDVKLYLRERTVQ